MRGPFALCGVIYFRSAIDVGLELVFRIEAFLFARTLMREISENGADNER